MPDTIQPNADYKDRTGFDPMFLGSHAALPKLSNAVRSKAFKLSSAGGTDSFELKYHHFSVVMNAKARLAFVAAVNYDARAPFRHTRQGSDRWFPDPRVDAGSQAGNEFYSDNPLDRGHLVRRTDAAWGGSEEEARRSNDDTFHFTNCSPQHEIFNQARKAAKADLLLWGNIEEHIARQAEAASGRLSIFNGPVFRSTDRLHRGLAVPREFWKIVVHVRSADNSLSALAFMLSQEGLIANLPLEDFEVGPYRVYQVKVREIEARTKLDFGELRTRDPLESGDHDPAFEAGSDAIALSSLADIIM